MAKVNFKEYIDCSDYIEKKLEYLHDLCESRGLEDEDFDIRICVYPCERGVDDDEAILRLIFHYKYLIAGEFECAVFKDSRIQKLEYQPEVETFLLRNGNDYKYAVAVNGAVIEEDLVSLYLEKGIEHCIDIILKEIGE
jgi:hypothetical protein